MAEEDEGEVLELVEEQNPRFRDALFGIRSVADIKDLATNPDYNPHVHLMILLTITYLVGIVSLALGT